MKQRVTFDGCKVADCVGSMGGRDVARVKRLLANAPADRSWRRRGYLTMCRAFRNRLQLRQEFGLITCQEGQQRGAAVRPREVVPWMRRLSATGRVWRRGCWGCEKMVFSGRSRGTSDGGEWGVCVVGDDRD